MRAASRGAGGKARDEKKPPRRFFSWGQAGSVATDDLQTTTKSFSVAIRCRGWTTNKSLFVPSIGRAERHYPSFRLVGSPPGRRPPGFPRTPFLPRGPVGSPRSPFRGILWSAQAPVAISAMSSSSSREKREALASATWSAKANDSRWSLAMLAPREARWASVKTLTRMAPLP